MRFRIGNSPRGNGSIVVLPPKGRKTWLVPVLILMLALFGCGGSGGGGGYPLGEWRICEDCGDAVTPPGPDSAWRTQEKQFIISSDVLEYDQQDGDSAWLMNTFSLAGPESYPRGIIANAGGRCPDLYINGMKLETGRAGMIGNAYAPAVALIPADFLRSGTNTVQVFVAGRGGRNFSLDLLDEPSYSRRLVNHELLYNLVPFAILIFNFSIFFPTIIFYLFNRRDRVFAHASMILLTYIVFIASMFIPGSLFGSLIPRLHLSLYPVFALLLLYAVQSLYRVYLSNFNRVVLPVNVVTFIAIMAASGETGVAYSSCLLLLGAVVIGASGIYMVRTLHRLRPDTILYAGLVFFIILAVGITLFDIISFIMHGGFGFLGVVYASPVMVIAFIVFTGREFMKNRIQSEMLYAQMRKNEKKQRSPAISESTEGKLNSVIDFIKENFNRDISREGLAGAIEISTDYMSRLFRTYTGKKINEYINELRVQEAMRLLRDDGDAKIIDIALAVGFESLSTFNRAFKQIAGVTPRDFRELA